MQLQRIASLSIVSVFCFVIALSSAFAKERPDLYEVAKSEPTLKTFLAAVKAAGLTSVLKGKAGLTLFAPTDKAFSAVGAKKLKAILANKSLLQRILKYHVVAGKVYASDLLKVQKAKSVEGGMLRFGLVVNGAKVRKADLRAKNGVIHIIDAVLIPKSKPKLKSQRAASLIRLAIERGVPLYNMGQAFACRAIYEVAVQSLLDNHKGLLSASLRSKLQLSLKRIKLMSDARAQAWTLRYALDAALRQLSPNRS